MRSTFGRYESMRSSCRVESSFSGRGAASGRHLYAVLKSVARPDHLRTKMRSSFKVSGEAAWAVRPFKLHREFERRGESAEGYPSDIQRVSRAMAAGSAPRSSVRSRLGRLNRSPRGED